MVLSEVEAEAQLAALRRQREALDRAIGDLTLYLELGRRLTAGSVSPVGEAHPSFPAEAGSRPLPERPEVEVPAGLRRRDLSERETSAERSAPGPTQPSSGVETRFSVGPPKGREAAPAGIVDLDHAATDGALSEGVLARRYGRALIEAALTALDEAGRPLHASEILAVLTQRGFSLPGHDPVAALNTRLWKRSGPGGPLKRMGEAVYALVEPEGAGVARGDEDED